MSKEYILLKEKSDSGIIALNKSVFESIVEISQDDIEGFQKYQLQDSQNLYL